MNLECWRSHTWVVFTDPPPGMWLYVKIWVPLLLTFARQAFLIHTKQANGYKQSVSYITKKQVSMLLG